MHPFEMNERLTGLLVLELNQNVLDFFVYCFQVAIRMPLLPEGISPSSTFVHPFCPMSTCALLSPCSPASSPVSQRHRDSFSRDPVVTASPGCGEKLLLSQDLEPRSVGVWWFSDKCFSSVSGCRAGQVMLLLPGGEYYLLE